MDVCPPAIALTLLRGYRPLAPGRILRLGAAGTATGVAGLLGFSIAHAVLIVPIWSRLPGGVPFALLAGLAMAWWFEESSGRHPQSLPRACFMSAALWLTLAPATFLAPCSV